MTRNIAILGSSLSVLLVGVFAATPAFADAFGHAGQVTLGIDRAFGIHYAHNTIDPPGPGENSSGGTTLGVGWYEEGSPLHQPRAALDVFVINHLSVGGTLAFFTQTGSDAYDNDGILFSPRVGYALELGSVVSFWPRGGPTFLKIGNASLFALTAEAMFVAWPRPNWGVTFGPTFDLGFIGSQTSNVNWTHFAMGLPAVGLVVTF